MDTYKIVILGMDAVAGKQEFICSFIEMYQKSDDDSTVEDSFLVDVEVDGEKCGLDVLDTAGQDEYSAMREQVCLLLERVSYFLLL